RLAPPPCRTTFSFFIFPKQRTCHHPHEQRYWPQQPPGEQRQAQQGHRLPERAAEGQHEQGGGQGGEGNGGRRPRRRVRQRAPPAPHPRPAQQRQPGQHQGGQRQRAHHRRIQQVGVHGQAGQRQQLAQAQKVVDVAHRAVGRAALDLRVA